MDDRTKPLICMILAGGAGRRIGGDKAFAMLAGRPLLTHVLDRIRPQCGPIAVNANDAAERYATFGIDVVADGALRGLGPLSGVLAALDWAATKGADRVLTVPVDTPFLPRTLAARLASRNAPIVLAETRDGLHGTCGVWDVALRGPLRQALRDGTRKVTEWTALNGAVPVRFPDTEPPAFFNINRPDDLMKAELWLAGPG